MSYFSIQTFIQSGQKSLADKNYWSALSVALMLPSMCSRIQFKDNSEYSNKKGDPHDRKCYEDFCNDCFKDDMWLKSCLGDNYAHILYQLRCDIVHAGCANIYDDGIGIYLSLDDYGYGTTTFTKHRVIDVKTLCEMIFNHIKSWCDQSGADGFKYTFVFNTSDKDDQLLYQRLCDRERSDYLLEKFDEEQAKRSEGT